MSYFSSCSTSLYHAGRSAAVWTATASRSSATSCRSFWVRIVSSLPRLCSSLRSASRQDCWLWTELFAGSWPFTNSSLALWYPCSSWHPGDHLKQTCQWLCPPASSSSVSNPLIGSEWFYLRSPAGALGFFLERRHFTFIMCECQWLVQIHWLLAAHLPLLLLDCLCSSWTASPSYQSVPKAAVKSASKT